MERLHTAPRRVKQRLPEANAGAPERIVIKDYDAWEPGDASVAEHVFVLQHRELRDDTYTVISATPQIGSGKDVRDEADWIARAQDDGHLPMFISNPSKASPIFTRQMRAKKGMPLRLVKFRPTTVTHHVYFYEEVN